MESPGIPGRFTQRSELVVVSGHNTAALRNELAPFGLRPSRIRGVTGRVGVGPDKSPAVALFEPRDGYTVMALSSEISAAALARWMEELKPVTEEQWVAAGGRIER